MAGPASYTFYLCTGASAGLPSSCQWKSFSPSTGNRSHPLPCHLCGAISEVPQCSPGTSGTFLVPCPLSHPARDQQAHASHPAKSAARGSSHGRISLATRLSQEGQLGYFRGCLLSLISPLRCGSRVAQFVHGYAEALMAVCYDLFMLSRATRQPRWEHLGRLPAASCHACLVPPQSASFFIPCSTGISGKAFAFLCFLTTSVRMPYNNANVCTSNISIKTALGWGQ